MRATFYLTVVIAMSVAVAVALLSEPIAEWMVPSGASSSQKERLVAFYRVGVLGPISSVAQPIPAALRSYSPSLLFPILFWIQVALLARRGFAVMAARRVVAPAGLNDWWIACLAIGLLPWLVGTIAIVVPRVMATILSKELAFASAIANAFFIPYLWIVASNVLGAAFFLVEALSLRKEGILPPSNPSSQLTPAGRS
jgi:hypothetical protein